MSHTLARRLILTASLFALTPLPAQTRVMGAPYNDASRAFIDLMIPHHETGMMMAEHAAKGARSNEVKEWAAKMAESEKSEIAELRALRRDLFGSDSSRSSMMARMMMSMHRMGDGEASHAMMDSTHMQGMQHMQHMSGGMQGMDRMFLECMIAHHEEAQDMAVLAEHSDADARVKSLAKKIREGQERETEQMRRLLSSIPVSKE